MRTIKNEKIQNDIINDVYDIIFNTRFRKEAEKRFKKRWWKKEISVEYNENELKIIRIGKRYTLTLDCR